MRGIGLLLGIELVADRDTGARFSKETRLAKRLTAAFRSEGLILRSDDDRVGIGPPLCITSEEADEIVAKMDRAFFRIESEVLGSK